MACYHKVHCPICKTDLVRKAGRNAGGEQRYGCQNPDCDTKTFMLNYRYRAYQPGIKEKIVDRAINGSGIRDTGRVLKISKDTVISTLKKSVPTCPSPPSNKGIEYSCGYGSQTGRGL